MARALRVVDVVVAAAAMVLEASRMGEHGRPYPTLYHQPATVAAERVEKISEKICVAAHPVDGELTNPTQIAVVAVEHNRKLLPAAAGNKTAANSSWMERASGGGTSLPRATLTHTHPTTPKQAQAVCSGAGAGQF